MESNYVIMPYEGVGKLRFGMTKEEVAKVLGPAEDSDIHPSGDPYEDRFDRTVLTIYSKLDNKLAQLGFSSRTKGVTYKSLDLFTAPSDEILTLLVNEDGQPYESLGIIVFLKLGITLSGFHDEDEDQKAVTVFTKGRWDKKMERLKPFKLKK